MSHVQNSSQLAQAKDQLTTTVITQATNSAISNATGGCIGELPPEVSAQAVKFLKQNPQECMQFMKYAAEAAAAASGSR